MANSATVRKNEDGTTEVVVYGAPVSNRLRGKGPGVPREEAATAIAMVAQMTGHGRSEEHSLNSSHERRSRMPSSA